MHLTAWQTNTDSIFVSNPRAKSMSVATVTLFETDVYNFFRM